MTARFRPRADIAVDDTIRSDDGPVRVTHIQREPTGEAKVLTVEHIFTDQTGEILTGPGAIHELYEPPWRKP